MMIDVVVDDDCTRTVARTPIKRVLHSTNFHLTVSTLCEIQAHIIGGVNGRNDLGSAEKWRSGRPCRS
jgi:hypothetical protein